VSTRPGATSVTRTPSPVTASRTLPDWTPIWLPNDGGGNAAAERHASVTR
jgi:hypothetical protein